MRKLTSIGLLFLAMVAAAQGTRPVVWKVNGIVGGNASVGLVSPSGVYTAPLSVPSPDIVTVSVMSLEDPTKSAAAQVRILPAPIRVTIAPLSGSVEVGKTLAFTQQVSGGVTISGGVSVGGGAVVAGYTPTVGIDLRTAGSQEVFVPANYEVGTFAYCTTPGCSSPTNGIPPLLTTFYEPKFANADGAVAGHAATSVYDFFNTPWVALKEGIPSSGDNSQRWNVPYPTKQPFSADDTYYYLTTLGGQADVFFNSGGSFGSRAVTWSFGTVSCSNGACGWLLSSHKSKFYYLEGTSLRVYDVPNNRWCSDISTCSSTSEIAYDTVLSGTGIGGNSGDSVPGSTAGYLPLTMTAVNPARVFRYDIAGKSSVEMADVPTGGLDYCELSGEGAQMFCRIAANNYSWNAATGAIQNGGSPVGGGGHSGFGLRPDGTPVQITFTGGAGNPCIQGIGYHSFVSPTMTEFFSFTSPRDPQSQCADHHFSAQQDYPNPRHFLTVFEVTAFGDTATVTAGALDPDWDDKWRYLSNVIGWCDVANVASDVTNLPNCGVLAHSRAYLWTGFDSAARPHISRTGCWVMTLSNLGTDTSSAAERRYPIRMGPLRAGC